MYMRQEAVTNNQHFSESDIDEIRSWLVHRLITFSAQSVTTQQSSPLETDTKTKNLSENMESLQSQLFDTSLLRLCQTAASSEEWRAEDDDNMQLREHSIAPGDCWLSIDPWVALWMDYRSFNNMPPLKTAGDFVLVSIDQHIQQREFTSSTTTFDICLLPALDLFKFWSTYKCKEPRPNTVHRNGKEYLALDKSIVDDMCVWIHEMREQFEKHGRNIFN
ncbi:uncharacterized protein LOC134193174 [Corticium candelabrum]|uniref:uncharacterized protein LOC134193174 n=1 Tax=Corticium candelabrum TaxID=121492 RepID=UPI002E252B88|nr:uncharacterized protein LOC134193174 [Corticium candelabrum]